MTSHLDTDWRETDSFSASCSWEICAAVRRFAIFSPIVMLPQYLAFLLDTRAGQTARLYFPVLYTTPPRFSTNRKQKLSQPAGAHLESFGYTSRASSLFLPFLAADTKKRQSGKQQIGAFRSAVFLMRSRQDQRFRIRPTTLPQQEIRAKFFSGMGG